MQFFVTAMRPCKTLAVTTCRYARCLHKILRSGLVRNGMGLLTVQLGLLPWSWGRLLMRPATSCHSFLLQHMQLTGWMLSSPVRTLMPELEVKSHTAEPCCSVFMLIGFFMCAIFPRCSIDHSTNWLKSMVVMLCHVARGKSSNVAKCSLPHLPRDVPQLQLVNRWVSTAYPSLRYTIEFMLWCWVLRFHRLIRDKFLMLLGFNY